jgi:hypothetical protein
MFAINCLLLSRKKRCRERGCRIERGKIHAEESQEQSKRLIKPAFTLKETRPVKKAQDGDSMFSINDRTPHKPATHTPSKCA